jgi:hypothetical protein
MTGGRFARIWALARNSSGAPQLHDPLAALVVDEFDAGGLESLGEYAECRALRCRLAALEIPDRRVSDLCSFGKLLLCPSEKGARPAGVLHLPTRGKSPSIGPERANLHLSSEC